MTGSVGKTSTKEAIYTVLKSKFDVVASQKSFNTPIGMSLAILGEEQSGFSSPKAWLKILWRTVFKSKKVPKKMILEMGADKPGDLNELIKIAPPRIGVVTAVREVHLAEGQFNSIESIAQEKGTLVRHLPSSGLAILNADDPRVGQMQTPANILFYGLDSKKAELKATHVEADMKGLKFRVIYQNQTEICKVPVIGEFQVYVCLPAIAVGLFLGMTLQECCHALGHYKLPPGRLNPIEGLKGTHILDGSYNASPSTVTTMLDTISNFSIPRKIAALGTMNELGKLSHQAHLNIGRKAAEVVQMLIAVGPEAQTLKQGALSAGMKEENIHSFFDSKEAGLFLKDHLQKGDLILVKGSQNKVRMERFVKEIMKEPQRASQLLCRQGSEWQEIS